MTIVEAIVKLRMANENGAELNSQDYEEIIKKLREYELLKIKINGYKKQLEGVARTIDSSYVISLVRELADEELRIGDKNYEERI